MYGDSYSSLMQNETNDRAARTRASQESAMTLLAQQQAQHQARMQEMQMALQHDLQSRQLDITQRGQDLEHEAQMRHWGIIEKSVDNQNNLQTKNVADKSTSVTTEGPVLANNHALFKKDYEDAVAKSNDAKQTKAELMARVAQGENAGLIKFDKGQGMYVTGPKGRTGQMAVEINSAMPKLNNAITAADANVKFQLGHYQNVLNKIDKGGYDLDHLTGNLIHTATGKTFMPASTSTTQSANEGDPEGAARGEVAESGSQTQSNQPAGLPIQWTPPAMAGAASPSLMSANVNSNGATSQPAAPNQLDTAHAQQVKADFKAGKISREQARQSLMNPPAAPDTSWEPAGVQ